MVAVRLRRVNRRPTLDRGEELADLSMDSRETSSHETYRRPGRRRFLNRLASGIRPPGFAMVIAETDGLMGCAFGFPLRADGVRWLGRDGASPRALDQLIGIGGAFAITGILVRPQPRDQEVARRLHATLLTGQQTSLGATSVDPADRRPTLFAGRAALVGRPPGSPRAMGYALPPITARPLWRSAALRHRSGPG